MWLVIGGLTAYGLSVAATIGIVFEVIFPDAAGWEKVIGAMAIGGLMGGAVAIALRLIRRLHADGNYE